MNMILQNYLNQQNVNINSKVIDLFKNAYSHENDKFLKSLDLVQEIVNETFRIKRNDSLTQPSQEEMMMILKYKNKLEIDAKVKQYSKVEYSNLHNEFA